MSVGFQSMAHNFDFSAFSSAQNSTPTLSSMSSNALADMVIDGFTAMHINGGEERSQFQNERREASSSSKDMEDDGENAKTKNDLDGEGMHCPICYESWGSEGDHQVSCLPCGHVYGMSCIRSWIQRGGGNGAKCPCKAMCTLVDIRRLYVSPILVSDERQKKKNEALGTEIASLKTEVLSSFRICFPSVLYACSAVTLMMCLLCLNAGKRIHDLRDNLLNVQTKLLSVQDSLLKELHKINESLLSKEVGRKSKKRQSDPYYVPSFSQKGMMRCKYEMEHELEVEDARLFDMDVSYQFLILARRISGLNGTHMLNKINLTCPSEIEDIQLSPSTKAVKDLHISPCGTLTLLASLGKKLSVLSVASNRVVINYDLPGPAWSCSWDLNRPHYMYAGLQNGLLLKFDMRKTMNPLLSVIGLTSLPIFSIHSLAYNPCHATHKVLTASSAGPCVWNTEDGAERPHLVPGLVDRGVCMSLAYSFSTDEIVASYRPKTQTSNTSTSSQSSQESSYLEPGIMGSQVHIKRLGDAFYHVLGSAPAHLCNYQMTKTAIVNMDNCFPMFAYADEMTNALRLRELPSLTVNQDLKPHQHPIHDIKFANTQGKGLLGGLSADKLQLFCSKNS